MKKNLTLEELTKIVARINSTQDIISLLDFIIETTKLILDTEGCSLLLYNKENDCLEFYVSKGKKSESLISLTVPKGKGIAGHVMKTLEPIIVNDAQHDIHFYKEIDTKVGYITKNIICVPMLAQGNFIGVIEAVNCFDRDKFDESDISTLLNISEISAVAIQNRFLFDELTLHLQEINGLFKVSESLSQIKESKTFLVEAGKAISDILGVERLSFIYKSKSKNTWGIVHSVGLNIEPDKIFIDETKGVLAKVILDETPLLVENTEKEDDLIFPFSINYKTRSFISIPMKIDGRIAGVVNITDKINKKSFTKTDLKLAGIIINYILEVFSSMNNRIQKENLEQLKRDLSIASKIQHFSLPEIPEILCGLELGALYIASREVGGDFYDIIYHNDKLHTFVIADVAGKGIPAALYMEYSKTILSSEIARLNSPAKAFTDCHKIFRNKFTAGIHVEVMALQVDSVKRNIKYASGGHNRQLFFDINTKDFILLRAKGIPLGSNFANIEFNENTISYNTGDLLVLYTDGITEAQNDKREMFGEERLMTVVKLYFDKPVKEIIKQIKNATDAFCQNVDMKDDYTLFIIRLN